MPQLDFVTSNAGHPMLVIDHYTFHKHSSNPKTGRTNWRCSRRRVKDIRCPSSCNTLNDYSSTPSLHDPNCHPYTNAELMAYRTKRNHKSQQSQIIQNSINFDTSRDINLQQVSNQSLIDDYNIDSFENREICSDEEEINDVLNDLDRNSPQFNQESEQNFDSQILSSQTESNDEHVDDYSSDMIQENIDSGNELSLNNFIDPNYTKKYISEIIDVNKKIEESEDIKNKEIISNNKSISFVTSKVGHPMLVVNHYTFHKHSTNPKTGRINWRCSRRRVKEIRCSSSCYTVNGIVSDPSCHDSNCLPLTDELLRNYQNKRAKISISSLINTKAESYTTNKNKALIIKSDYDELQSLENSELSIPEPIYTRPRLFYKNKRKENYPIRANENLQQTNTDEYQNNLTISNIVSDISHNTRNENSEDNEEFFENEYDEPNNSDYIYDQNEEHNENLVEYDINQAYETKQNEKNINQNNESANTSVFSYQEYDTMNCSSSPESFSKLLNDLANLKEKEKNYAQKLKR